SSKRGPVVAWNITRKCNFKCKHCYSDAALKTGADELSFEEIKSIIDEMKKLNVPVILLSGGEPLMHEHIFEIIDYIRTSGIRVSLSTNGSLITEEAALRLKNLGVSYVGIRVDIKDQIMTNDQARDFVERLVDYTLQLKEKGIKKEILTVTNHSDDQFSRFMPLGSVREASLSDIWVEGTEDLKALRNKRDYLNKRCSGCRWLDICGGNLRARAYQTTGDLWGEDPGCYLGDDEI
ncbi:hypothetical protein ADUPG1_004266, partial [Aduncisulcus paluster]